MRTTLSVSMLAVVAILVGCATFQRGETVVQYRQGSPVRMGEAPADGRYALYSGTDLRNPQIQYALKKGDRIGFEERDGQVYAVAGQNEDRIETTTLTRSYFWRKLSE